MVRFPLEGDQLQPVRPRIQVPCCPTFQLCGGHTQSETNVHRLTLFPIYFQQRSKIPEKNYTALVPIYGTIKQRLFRDENQVCLIPYLRPEQEARLRDRELPLPLLPLRHGEGLRGWQAWPLFGHEHKEVTTRTNHWGDLETVGGHEKFFVLWPFFFDQQTGLGTKNLTHEQALIPFYSFLRSPARDSPPTSGRSA